MYESEEHCDKSNFDTLVHERNVYEPMFLRFFAFVKSIVSMVDAVSLKTQPLVSPSLNETTVLGILTHETLPTVVTVPPESTSSASELQLMLLTLY